jgi:hypothetical protein
MRERITLRMVMLELSAGCAIAQSVLMVLSADEGGSGGGVGISNITHPPWGRMRRQQQPPGEDGGSVAGKGM